MTELQKNQFLITRPTAFSKNKIDNLGKKLRDNESFDQGLLDQFLEHQARICDEILIIIQESISSLENPPKESDSSIVPYGSNTYYLTARVKTQGTIVDKLRRMPDYHLNTLSDISGVRLDCDFTLTEQTDYAKIFQESLIRSGANSVDIKDIRKKPHSGYRAIHLRIKSPAGCAELQIRTALQAKWANLYEIAADIYGRNIRYLNEATITEPVKHEIMRFHDMSDRIYEAERQMCSNDVAVLAPGVIISRNALNELNHSFSRMLEEQRQRLIRERSKI